MNIGGSFISVPAQLGFAAVNALKIGPGFEFDRISYANTNNYTTTVAGTGAVTFDGVSRSLNLSTGGNALSKAAVLLNTRWNCNFAAGWTMMFSFLYNSSNANSQFFIGVADNSDGWGNFVGLYHKTTADTFRLETWDGAATDSSTWTETANTWTDLKLVYDGASVKCYTGPAGTDNLTLRATNTTHIPGAVRASPVAWAYNGATATDRTINVKDFRVLLG